MQSEVDIKDEVKSLCISDYFSKHVKKVSEQSS